jgi:phage-related baseplate assembly protein
MSSFTQIDLSTLPAPNVVEALSFESILAAMLADLQARDPAFSALVESDPAYKILEVCAYRELIVRQRVNDAARATMLAYAVGADLDQIGALFGVARFTITPANPAAVPPVAAVMETDKEFRRRIQLSLEGFSVAGPEGSYIFHSLSADADVLDVSATSPSAGQVLISVLSRVGNGVPTTTLLNKVSAALNATSVRPITDLVTVQAAAKVDYAVTAQIYTYIGPDSSVVQTAATNALNTYIASVRRVGLDVTLSGIYAALHQPGVQRVVLASPASNVVINATQYAHCTGITLTSQPADE